MNRLVIAKFGGSAIGVDGISIPIILQRINELKKSSKVIAIFSAPLTIHDGEKRSLTDIAIELGKKAEKGQTVDIDEIKRVYEKIFELVGDN